MSTSQDAYIHYGTSTNPNPCEIPYKEPAKSIFEIMDDVLNSNDHFAECLIDSTWMDPEVLATIVRRMIDANDVGNDEALMVAAKALVYQATKSLEDKSTFMFETN